jgi:hypothetical protein
LSFLLKIDPAAIEGATATVPRMKSAKLDVSDIGARVFLWFDDPRTETGALAATSTLEGFEELKIAQVRDPSKRKDAYRLTLSPASSDVSDPLTTDDLGPYRDGEGASALETLGRLRGDRNHKIIRLSDLEDVELSARFRQ